MVPSENSLAFRSSSNSCYPISTTVEVIVTSPQRRESGRFFYPQLKTEGGYRIQDTVQYMLLR